MINLAGRLDQEGFKTLVAAGRPEPGEGDMLEELAATDVQFETIPFLQRGLNPINDFKALGLLRRLVRSFRPDLIHTHTAKAGLLGRLAASAGKPCPVRVHTYHGHVLDSYFGSFRSTLFRSLERNLAGATGALIAVAPSVRDELVARHGVGEWSQYQIIPSGLPVLDLDGARSLREELGLGDALVIGFVGRLVPIKGFEEFLEAIPGVVTQVPGVRFLVAGDGPLRSLALSFARKPPWDEVLCMAGLRSDRERILRTLDIMALPSRKEGLPTVLLESALAGVPVVASRIPGVTDLFDESREALLFEPRSARSLADALARLCADPDLGKRLALHARQKVIRQVPDYAEVAQRHAGLYRNLLQKERVYPESATW